MDEKRKVIAKNIAAMLHDGNIVNLGVGIPTMVGNYLANDVSIFLHGENGCIGQDRQLPFEWDINDRDSVIAWLKAHGDSSCDWRSGHRDLNNASDAFITLTPGACCFDSVTSFVIARGGHLDATVLGALQVDEEGNLANWTVPGKKLNGMGGAMDLVAGAKKVIAAMEHCTKNAEPKFVRRCTMPLTGEHCVDVLVTELCIVEFENNVGTVTAIAPGISREHLQSVSGASLKFAENVKQMLTL